MEVKPGQWIRWSFAPPRYVMQVVGREVIMTRGPSVQIHDNPLDEDWKLTYPPPPDAPDWWAVPATKPATAYVVAEDGCCGPAHIDSVYSSRADAEKAQKLHCPYGEVHEALIDSNPPVPPEILVGWRLACVTQNPGEKWKWEQLSDTQSALSLREGGTLLDYNLQLSGPKQHDAGRVRLTLWCYDRVDAIQWAEDILAWAAENPTLGVFDQHTDIRRVSSKDHGGPTCGHEYTLRQAGATPPTVS